MGKTLDNRRADSKRRLDELRKDLAEAERIVEGRACVYMTGSFGRGEASGQSDLDLFIVGKEDGDPPTRCLPRLDEICVKAELIHATRTHKIPEFTAGGQYLIHYTVRELTQTLGKPHDDATNTFTAR